MLQSLLSCLAFFTRLPLPARAHGPWRAGMAACMPVVGLVVGGCAALAAFGASRFLPSAIAGILGALAWAAVTGGLHLDGVADCGDGFFCAADREKRLEIMKDPRTGAFGVVAVVFAVLLKAAALAHLAALDQRPLFIACLLAGLLGRAAAAQALAKHPMARPGGLGDAFRQNTRAWEGGAVFLQVVVAAVLACCFGSWKPALAAVLCAGAVAVLLPHLAIRKIGGLTGDVLGALIEGVEIAVLLAFCASY